MKAVFTHIDSARVGLCKSLLDEAGIACFVRNELWGYLPFVPMEVFCPALCVLNDEDFDRARSLIAAQAAPVVATGREWICPHCQSVVPAGFDKCWNCERDRGSSE